MVYVCVQSGVSVKTRAVNSRKHPALSLNNAEIKAEKRTGGGEGGRGGGVIGLNNLGSTWGLAIAPTEACGRRVSSFAARVAAPQAREGRRRRRPTVHLRRTSAPPPRASPIREANASCLMENKGSNLKPSPSNSSPPYAGPPPFIETQSIRSADMSSCFSNPCPLARARSGTSDGNWRRQFCFVQQGHEEEEGEITAHC